MSWSSWTKVVVVMVGDDGCVISTWIKSSTTTGHRHARYAPISTAFTFAIA